MARDRGENHPSRGGTDRSTATGRTVTAGRDALAGLRARSSERRRLRPVADGAPPTAGQVIMNRLAENSRPGSRLDDHRVALVVEGGGMRGVITAGMLLALEQLGIRNSIDFVVGTSAGAIASAFFVTGLGSRVAPVYYRDLNHEPFLNKRRLLRLQPALDIDYLIDNALMARGLSPHAVATNPVPVFATVSPVDQANDTRLLRVDGSDDRVRAILKATASLPVLGGPAKVVDGAEYVDGGLWSQIPWRAAADLGATHILALPSRPIKDTEWTGSRNFFERYTVLPLIRNMHGDHVADTVATMGRRASEEAAALWNAQHGLATLLTSDGARWDGQVEFVEVAPETPLPERLETEQSVLVDAMRDGAQAVVDHFGLHTIDVEPRITLDHPAARIGAFRSDALSQIVAARWRAMNAEGGSADDGRGRLRRRRSAS